MKRTVLHILLALAAVAVLLLHAGHYGSTWTDDAYITFRYARNFAAGQGMAFNPGERVEGLTNLGWALLLAPFARFDLLTVAQGFGLAAGVGTVLVLAAWVRRQGVGLVGTAVALAVLVLCPWLPLWTLQGLETPVVGFVMTLGWTRYLAEAVAPSPRPRGEGWGGGLFPLSAVALGLAPWLRPDAALLPLLLGGWHVFTRGSRPSRHAALSAGLVVAFGAALVALKLAWFGAVLPNSYHIKVDHFPPDRGLAYLENFLTLPSAVLPALILASVGASAVWARRRDDRAVPGLVFAAWLLAATLENGDFMPNYRLLVPAWPAACAALGLAVDAALRRLRGPALTLGAVTTATVGVVALVPQANAFYLDELNRPGEAVHKPMFPATKTVPVLTPWKSTRWGRGPVAQLPFPTAWTLVNAGPDEAVAYTELGLISYLNDGPIVDLLGLTDRVMGSVDGQEWPEQWAYVQKRVSFLIVNTEAGAWPRWSEAMKDGKWTVAAGCGPTWVFANPALPKHPPEAAELERRLALALERAPRHDELHEAIARELGHARVSRGIIADYLEKAQHLRHPTSPSIESLRADLGLRPGFTSTQDQCLGGDRVVPADVADPAAWPLPAADFAPPAPERDPDRPPPDAKATPDGAADPACVAARERAASAWRDARGAWAGERGPGADDARRLARVASTAVQEGGAAASTAVEDAVRAARAAGASAVAASEAAEARSREAREACGE